MSAMRINAILAVTALINDSHVRVLGSTWPITHLTDGTLHAVRLAEHMVRLAVLS